MGNKLVKKEEVFIPEEKIKEKAYLIERQILSNSGLKIDEEVYIDDVEIDYYGKNYLHTIRCGRKEENIPNHVIFIHGYQGSSITFYKLFKFLYPKYNVYCPDILGMALSSRPNVHFKSTEDWLTFFVDSFEKWRESLGITKVHLVGHSLGGYLAALYSVKHPQHVFKLTLLSPAGITDVNKGGSIHEKMPFSKKLGFNVLGTIWGIQPTMKGMYDNIMTRMIMKPSLRKRYEVSNDENELLAKLTEYSFQYPRDLDKAIYYIFKHPIPTVNFPLEDVLFEMVKSFKVDFYFGEQDWMDQAGSIRLCERDKNRFKMFVVPKYGHNFNLENPQDLANLFIENNILEEIIEEVDHLLLDNKMEVNFKFDKINQNSFELKEITELDKMKDL